LGTVKKDLEVPPGKDAGPTAYAVNKKVPPVRDKILRKPRPRLESWMLGRKHAASRCNAADREK